MTVDGTDYYKQYLPPTLVDLSGSPDLMVAQMDYAGVDRAVLQAGHLYGELNSFLARAVKKHPTRFWALAQVSEWRLRHRSQRKRLERAIDECLNEHLFAGLAEARRIIAEWRYDYNTTRPHTSLDGLTPNEFAARPNWGHNLKRFYLVSEGKLGAGSTPTLSGATK